MKKYFLGALLFLIPLIFHSQISILINPFVFSQIAVIALSFVFILTMTKMPFTIRLFYIWCLASVFTSRIPHFSAISFLVVTLFLLLYKSILNLNKQDLQYCFAVISAACAVQVFWIFAQILNHDFAMNCGRGINMTYGTMGNHNILSAFFLFSIVPMYFYRKWAIVLPIIGVFYSGASASIYALMGGIIFYFLFSKQNRVRPVLVALLITGTLLFMKVDNPFMRHGNGRFPVWRLIITKCLADRPAIGRGLGTFREEYWTKIGATYDRKTKETYWPQAHNVYIQTMREQGIVGLVLLLCIPVALFVECLWRKRDVVWMSGVVMACLNMIGNFPDRNFTLALLMVFVFACCQAFNTREELWVQ